MCPSQLEFRSYQYGDEAAILELFEAVYGKPMSLEYWRWRFIENPVGGRLIELAWDGDQLAAHYAVSAFNVCDNHVRRRVALSVSTMTGAKYRGLGLFTKLAERLFERLKREDYSAVVGFPNNNSHDGFIKHLGWSDIALLPQLSCELFNLKKPYLGRIVQLVQGDERLDDLWQSARQQIGLIHTWFDRPYLDWRFHRHPHIKYLTFGIEENDKLLGIFVIKAFGETSADVVAWLGADRNAEQALPWAAATQAKAMGFKQLNTWISLHLPAYCAATQKGFVPSLPITYFSGRALSLDAGRLYDPRLWQIRMADSDVY